MELHPKYPVVEGDYQMTRQWRISLPERFNRRIEDSNLVIWRPGFTMWTAVWNNDNNETPEERLKWISEESSPEAYDKKTEKKGGLLLYSYRLKEEQEGNSQPAFYCYAIGGSGHVQIAIYFDDAKDLSMAEKIWRGLSESPGKGGQ